MSDLALAFLERWIEENVQSVPAEERAAEAERLSAQCLEDAEREGITEEELLGACAEAEDGESDDADLTDHMLQALTTASMEELDDDEEED